MSVYFNNENSVKAIPKASHIISGRSRYELYKDTSKSDITKHREQRTSDVTYSQSIGTLRARFTEPIMMKGMWSETEADTGVLSEVSDPVSGSQSISLTITTDPIEFDTGVLEDVYISVLRPEDTACTIGKVLRYDKGVLQMWHELQQPQSSQSHVTHEIELSECIIHTQAKLTRDEIKAWNARSQAMQQNDNLNGEDTKDTEDQAMTSILGETGVTFRVQIFAPEEDRPPEDLDNHQPLPSFGSVKYLEMRIKAMAEPDDQPEEKDRPLEDLDDHQPLARHGYVKNLEMHINGMSNEWGADNETHEE